MKRKGGLRVLYPAILALLFLPMVGQVSAAESVTTLNERTLTVTGTWEKNNASRIPFTIDDFQGFRFVNLSYEMVNPTAGISVTECGLVFKLMPEGYFAAWRNGSARMFVLLGEGYRLRNSGSITFDPRANPEPAWQEGQYRLLVHMKPENCVNEVHLRLDLVRDTEGITTTPLPPATTAGAAPQGTTSAPAMTVKEQAALPGTTLAAVGSGTPVMSPTQPPLPGYLPCLAVMAAILVFGGRLARR